MIKKYSLNLMELHRHAVPLALAVRLITLTSTPSLAVAATLPDYGAVTPNAQVAAATLPVDSFLNETNEARIEAGLSPLSLNESLTEAAQSKVQDMIALGYWDHFRPTDQKAPWDFIKEAHYTYKVAGENLARGYKTPHGVTEAWMASPAHRANILKAEYKEVGFATGFTTNESGERVMLTVQMFGAK